MEQNNQIKHKNKGLTFILVLLLTITIIASSIGLWAWAKYTSAQNGNATAQIAKWNFDLKLKEGKQNAVETSGPINLASTQFNHVANDRIAPGTSGLFYVIVDTAGTEVDVLYNVNITLENCPRNIKFYRGTDATTGEELSLGGVNSTSRSFSFSRYLQAKGTNGNENGKKEEPIYWVWDYSGAIEGSATTYDQWDTADSNLGTTTMTITATGTEQLEPPAAPKAIGDTVNYSTTLNGETLSDWSVFYVDGDYTYIILDDYLFNSAVSDTMMGTYSMGTNGSYSIAGDVDRNVFISAMTTISNWSDLINNGSINGTALSAEVKSNANIWANGSPTLELWVNSWNAKYPSDTLYTEYSADVNNSGYNGCYISDSTELDTNESYYISLSSKTGYNNALYFPHQNSVEEQCSGYYLASPSAEDSNQVMYVNCGGDVGDSSYDFDGYAFRPVIKLPSNIIN